MKTYHMDCQQCGQVGVATDATRRNAHNKFIQKGWRWLGGYYWLCPECECPPSHIVPTVDESMQRSTLTEDQWSALFPSKLVTITA